MFQTLGGENGRVCPSMCTSVGMTSRSFVDAQLRERGMGSLDVEIRLT